MKPESLTSNSLKLIFTFVPEISFRLKKEILVLVMSLCAYKTIEYDSSLSSIYSIFYPKA